MQNFSGSDEVIKEMEIQGLAKFTAFSNFAIKVLFDDRTIVRMQKGYDVVKILSSQGEELVFNLNSIARNQLAQKKYQNYI